jgi:RNA polymerase sigma-70 factor, ECF subfamily
VRLTSVLVQVWHDDGPGEPDASVVRDDALEAALTRALADGRARWPTLDLSPDSFVSHLARALPRGTPGLAGAVAGLHAADLYLACACANGAPVAISLFEETHLARLAAALAGVVVVTPEEIDEVRQQLRVKLLVGDPPAARPPLIATYSARGSLASWVRVAAVRQALTLVRDARIGARAGRRAADEGALGAALGADPELDFIKGRYRRDFEIAFGAALLEIADRDRALLRMHVVAGLTLEKIGAIYHVDRSTVSRWLSDARRDLLDRTELQLRGRLGIAPAEFESMARLLTSQLEIDLPELLRTSGGAPKVDQTKE